jgi:proteasome lid subunit RPN8/RPN11
MGMTEDDVFVYNDSGSDEPPRRDADLITVDEVPMWKMPPTVKGRQHRYQMLVRRSVLNDIRAHARSNPEVEVCGVLVGKVYHDGHAPWGWISANIRGNYASGRNAQVTFKSETWTHIHQEMEARFQGQRILGWYHSHPGFGIFLSEMDVFIQENFFAESWQVAFVDDPRSGDRGLFVWRKGQTTREEFLVEEDVTETTAADVPALESAPAYETIAPANKRPAWPIVVTAALVVAALGSFAVWWLR